MDTWSARESARRVGAKQAGRISRWQLHHLGVSDDQVRRWVEGAYLVPKLPKVFAIGHDAPSREADLWEAILYAGPSAVLSHATAAHRRGLIDYPPQVIEVSTPRRINSLSGIRVYGRRPLDRCIFGGIPVTSIPQTGS
jgi:predicted transcriptional regulator of viral defense system